MIVAHSFVCSMTPSFVVPTGHLRLQEAPESAITSPAHAIALLDPALHDYILANDNMDIDPDTVPQHLVELRIGIGILAFFSPAELAPKAFATPVAVFGQSTRAHRQYRRRILSVVLLLLR